MIRTISVFCIVLWSVGLAAQTSDALKSQGDAHLAKGQTRKAGADYERAAQLAATADEKVSALIGTIETIRGSRRATDLSNDEVAKTVASFEAALPLAVGPLSFKLHNDYGVFLLDRGEPAKAVAVFKDGRKDLDSLPRRAAARYLYNYALAQLRTGDLEDPFTTYRSAVDYDPSFPNASEATFSLLSKFPADRAVAEAMGLIESLVDAAQFDLASKYLHAALGNHSWQSSVPVYAPLVRLFARYLLKTQSTPETFAAEWQESLAHIRGDIPPEAASMIDQLSLAYVGELPLLIDNRRAREIFSSWSQGEDAQFLSRLLKVVGDAYAKKEKYREACTRYASAWSLDTTNVSAASYLTDALTRWNTDDARRMMNNFVEQAFMQKSDAYLGKDLASILRLHMVLGSTFARLDRWTPPSDPQTASFQFEHALAAYEQLKKQDPSTSAYPMLYANVAAAYVRTGRPAEAWHAYILAGEANLAIGAPEAAQAMLSLADNLGYAPPDADLERLTQLRSRITALLSTPAAAPSDDDLVVQLKSKLAAYPQIDLFKIDVQSKGGEVLLTGTVTDERKRNDIEKVARDTAGVKAIINHIEAKPLQ